MRGQHLVVGAIVMTMTVSGCASFRDLQWGGCAVAGAVIGGAVGGIAGGVIVNNVEDASDGETGGAIAGGVVGGAALGALLGHVLCDPPTEMKVAQVPPPAPGTKILELKGPNFDTAKATLHASGKAKLDQAIATLKANAAMNVSIEGHTDSVGSDAYNQALSDRRAQTVRDYLVAGGIASSRLTATGYGESRPSADNGTAEGREQNRRVELLAR